MQFIKPYITDDEKKAVQSVLDSGMLAQGSKVKEAEEKCAALFGVKNTIAVNSGTAALHTALFAAGIGAGDEVITSPFTFVATANSILMQNAKPVFADIDPDTFNIDPAQVKEKITSSTKAILPVDLYGQIYDHKSIQNLAKQEDLRLVEDACQAVNAASDGKKVGAFADLTTFSFYATKNVMCGEGGLILTDDDVLAESCRMFRHHGQSAQKRYLYFHLGYNYRMMDLQAAILLEQLKKMDFMTDNRIKNAKYLTEHLSGVKGVTVPFVSKGNKHVFHQYTIKVDSSIRDKVCSRLNEKGVPTAIFYPIPLHLQEHFKIFGYKEGDFPVAERVAKEVISLPVHPLLTDDELALIIKGVKEVMHSI